MKPKPKHLTTEYATQFQDKSIVDVYHLRPPYPPATFEILSDLIEDRPRAVLDAGCGTGPIARHLIDYVDRIDAVDFSEHMIARARAMPNGDHPNITWTFGPMETAPIQPPYGLITAGASLHWMAWDVVLPRFHAALAPGGVLALPSKVESGGDVWKADLFKIIKQYSTNRDFQPYNLVDELESRKLFRKVGTQRTAPVPYTPSIPDYIELMHSRNGFSRDRMTSEAAAAFDSEFHALLTRHYGDGPVTLEIQGEVIWGFPLAGH